MPAANVRREGVGSPERASPTRLNATPNQHMVTQLSYLRARRVSSIGAGGTTDTSRDSGPMPGGDVPSATRTAHRETCP
jgi:hypothetical protein